MALGFSQGSAHMPLDEPLSVETEKCRDRAKYCPCTERQRRDQKLAHGGAAFFAA